MSLGLRPMRVIYFVSLFPCWSETFIVREVQELIGFGVDVRIVSLKHPSEKLVQSDALALIDRVIYPVSWRIAFPRVMRQLLLHPMRESRDLLGLLRQLISSPSDLAKSVAVWWRTLGLLPIVKSLAPDHLHAHWATFPSTAAMLASTRLEVPFSFTAHAHDIFLHDHLLAEKMRRAAFGITISEFNRQYLSDTVSPMATHCMRIVHCGVSPAAFAYEPEGRRSGFILAVGRLDEIKGFIHLIDACCLLLERGVAFQCDIIGEGPLRATLQRRIDSSGLTAHVRLLGALSQEEVRRNLLQASVFVLPSVVTARGDRDGIPVALMEAMAVGLPVVSTRVSGIPELVVDGVTGLLAEPGDSSGLANAVARALTEPESVAGRVLAARKRIEQHFDVAKEARKLYEMLPWQRLHFKAAAETPGPAGTGGSR